MFHDFFKRMILQVQYNIRVVSTYTHMATVQIPNTLSRFRWIDR